MRCPSRHVSPLSTWHLSFHVSPSSTWQVLKLCVTVQLVRGGGDADEGRLTQLRSQLIANRHLARLLARRFTPPAFGEFFAEIADSSLVAELHGVLLDDRLGEFLGNNLPSAEGLVKKMGDAYEALIGMVLLQVARRIQSAYR